MAKLNVGGVVIVGVARIEDKSSPVNGYVEVNVQVKEVGPVL